LWDRGFVTRERGAVAAVRAARGAAIAPLEGPSNVAAPGVVIRRVMRQMIATIAIR